MGNGTAMAARPRRGLKVVEPESATVRCAVYTRKSTEEGLDSDFNSLDAQREAAEAYIQSQRSAGWTCLPEHYDDGGFTGGNVERPALQKLLADIEAGGIDCVMVYKVDRLSRSLFDFARIMGTFDRHGVSFVSVTQQFNTTTSMGRLTLNVLLSFAQFEREIISERTRDKLAAARKKGKWIGGQPVLGYDIDHEKKRLVVNPDEAEVVRTIFGLYFERRTLAKVIDELDRRAVRTKSWITTKGERTGGRPFNKQILRKMLANPTYVGKVRYKGKEYPGEHDGIVDQEVFDAVGEILRTNKANGGAGVHNKHNALLRGLLYCAACDALMTHSFTKKGSRVYRYYVCGNAARRGWDRCPTKSVPAHEIEDFVVSRLRQAGRDGGVQREIVKQIEETRARRKPELDAEHRLLRGERERLKGEIAELVRAVGEGRSPGGTLSERIAEIDERLGDVERRLAEVRGRLLELEQATVDEGAVAAAVARFDPVWEVLFPRERIRIIQLLVEKVVWDREAETVEIAFRPAGIRSLAAEGEPGGEASE